jgi:hypothetical protein
MSTTQQPQAPSLPTPQAQADVPSTDYETIRAIIHGWPPDLRAALIHDLVNTLVKETEETNPRPRRKKASEVIGILNMGQPAPTDEEVERIIQEHREAKYG